eukprot:TRINITY_DN5186_c0_g1_i1.p1 TRINITY_DN5186_c0_g1~~TRINITY_DN5186_c0_g1_i1.p1  ORF type:complete len:322 (+),score=100.34 TRINITY_DN5186_c0_g1_i1:812-1777(+)
MWSRLRYEVEDEEEFERRPMYKYHVRQHHLGLFDKLQMMSYKSALPIPGGDVIEERGDDLLTRELNHENPKRLKKLFTHLSKIELQPAPDYDYDFLLEPLEAGMPDLDKSLREEEEDEEDRDETAIRTEGDHENEDEIKIGGTTKEKGEGGAEPKNLMTLDEAKKVLEAKVVSEEDGKEVYDMEDLEKKYKLLFSLNDPAAGGSVYLAMKIQAAYDVLLGKDLRIKPNKEQEVDKKDDRVDKLKSEHKAQQSKFNPNIKSVRIPNPFYIPQFWQDMNVEEKKLAEHVMERLEPEIEWREKFYEDKRRRATKGIPDAHKDYY